MLRSLTARAAVLLAALAVAAPAAVYRFDCGTDDSPLEAEFVRLTPAGGGGAVWATAADNLEARTAAIVRGWEENSRNGKQQPPIPYYTELNCDYISGTGPATLRLPVPAGPYRVWILSGHGSGGHRHQVWDVAVAAGTAEARSVIPGPVGMRQLQLEASADSQGLALTFSSRSRWLVNAVVAVPLAEWAQAEAEVIAPLWADSSTLPRAELSKWKRQEKVFDDPEPVWSEAQKENGFALFSRPWTEPVWPQQYPRLNEINAPVRAFASWDEYEPLTFSIHPLRDFKEVDVQVSPLRNAAGQQIPATAIDVRHVRYMLVRPNYSLFNVYYTAPDVLMPWAPRPLRQGENLRFWLTVYVQPQTPEGFYTGTAVVSLDDRRVEVPLMLRVLPITLQKDQSLVFGQYYHHPLAALGTAPDDFSRQWWYDKAVAEHQHLRDSGMNNITISLWGVKRNGRWLMNYDHFQRCIDLTRQFGFQTPVVCGLPLSELYRRHMNNADMGSHLRLVQIPPPEFFVELTEMVGSIESEARRRQWPELLYYPVDEPSTTAVSVEFMTRVMQAIKQVPGVRTYVTADPSYKPFDPLRPYVDVWSCQPFSLSREQVQKEMAERPGLEYWCYPNHISGENDHTPTVGARMTFGFGLWRSGFKALIPWIYQSLSADPWNYLDGTSSDFVCRTDDDGKPIPVALWEAQREGIDDGRYIFTLENWIRRAEEAGFKEAASAARRDLQAIEDSILVQPKYKDQNLWNAETFDVYRWLLATHILKIQSLFQL